MAEPVTEGVPKEDTQESPMDSNHFCMSAEGRATGSGLKVRRWLSLSFPDQFYYIHKAFDPNYYTYSAFACTFLCGVYTENYSRNA